MDRDTAFKMLGLYVGASPDHIQSKYQPAAEQLQAQMNADPARRAELSAQLRRLTLARDVALGRGEESVPAVQSAGTAATLARTRRHRLVALVALVVCVGIVLLGIRWLNEKQAAQDASKEQELAVANFSAWDNYRARVGLAQSPDGERATAKLQDAQRFEEQGDYARAGQVYVLVTELAVSAFAAETARLFAHWQNEVREPWSRLQTCFPFDETSQVEADPGLVAKLFNPVSGAVWSRQGEFDALANTSYPGPGADALPMGYKQALEDAGRIREALFGTDSEQVHVMFSIKVVEETKTFADLVLETGGTSINHRSPHFASATWTPTTAGARLLLKKALDRTPAATPIDFGESNWGMLQLLRHCTYIGLHEGEHVWEVEFDGLADRRGKTRSITGGVRIRLDRAANPFEFATYRNFKP